MSKQETLKYSVPPAELALLVAAALDLLGEPPAPWHPVVWYGKLIHRLEQAAPSGKCAQLFYGALMLFLATTLVLPLALLTRRLALRLYRISSHHRWNVLYALIMGSALKPFFAQRLLVHAGCTVRLQLERGDLPAAREALQSLVSRERSHLSTDLAAAAAIESLAENLSDSVVAPLFYYTLFGLPGAALYRLYNTFDSMVGYRGRYEYLGKAAARLDDLLNLLPARLTALLIIGAAPLYGGEPRRAWHIWRRDAHKTASPNAGHPMSAAAGALGVRLEKVDNYVLLQYSKMNREEDNGGVIHSKGTQRDLMYRRTTETSSGYILGDPTKPIEPADIKRAEHMVWWVGGIAFVLAILCKRLWRTRRA